MSDLKQIHAQRKWLQGQNRKYDHRLVEVAREDWPGEHLHQMKQVNRVLRSKDFLVIEYQESPSLRRLSICRAMIDDSGRWKDGITWEELQRIKDEVGYSTSDAIEVYPAKEDCVNVANMRHLWVDALMPKLNFVWRNNKEHPCSTTQTPKPSAS